MDNLPTTLYTPAQVQALDRLAIEQFGIPGYRLMVTAGVAAFDRLQRRWPEACGIAVLCGTGNNGGDGYVVARLAHEAGLHVQVLRLGDAGRLRGDALSAAQAAEQAGVVIDDYQGQELYPYDVIVDALLGTGLSGAVDGPWAAAIEAINASGVPVLALDIPSGLSGDNGAVLGGAVRAVETVTFLALKRGLYTGRGPDHTGHVSFHSLGVPDGVYEAQAPAARRLGPQSLPHFPPRPRAAHKGDFGHVLLVGGERGYSGAIRLAGEAAARCGAGLVSIATRREHAAVIAAARPELMCHGVEQAAELAPLLERADVVAVGPGLGQGPWARALLGRVLESRKPLLLDADALNLLAAEPLQRADWVLTPHPGEAGRLLGIGTEAVQADRFAAVQALQERFGGVCVLKGRGSLIAADEGRQWLCDAGNPGMASGGMGDVLSGIIAALMAQGQAPAEAAWMGTLLHALAADRAARRGERGLLASDLFEPLHALVNGLGGLGGMGA